MGFDLTCYRLGDYAVPIEPARYDRAIFDANRHAYRCLPLTVANTAGWELLCPTGVTIEWNGGPGLPDLTVTFDEPSAFPFAKSNFATGIVTFDLGWLFRTPPGCHLWAMGPPNDPKDGIAPLSGLIETDWLPYAFTMNWKMTRPGKVRFEKGEPFCFITPARIADVADCQPTLRQITDDADLQATLRAWTDERDELMVRFRAGDPETLKHPWGRRYFRGEQAEGSTAEAPAQHFQKLRAKPPARRSRDIRCASDAEGLDFLVIDDLLPPSLCRALARTYADHVELYETSREPFWDNRLLGYRDILAVDPSAAAAVRGALARAIGRIGGFYGVAEPLYADVAHLVGWREGQGMPAHSDNTHPDGRPHEYAHRAFSGVLYLSDDHEGGDLYLPRHDILIKPKPGLFVSLPAGPRHEHAVTRVERGVRTTMAFFLTLDRERSDPALRPTLEPVET